MLKQPPLISIALLELLIVPFSYAGTSTFYPPRLTGQFLTGNSQQAAGFADLMFPLWNTAKTNFVFADGTVVKGNDGRLLLSGGLGARAVYASNIVGAYVFAEHAQTRLNQTYWQINPGIEWLKANYEARLQAYLPTSRKFIYANTYASSIPDDVYQDLGTYRTGLARAFGHTVIDTPISLAEEAGTGVEIEGGRFFAVGKGVWARAGAYHFNYPTAQSVNGVEGNIEISLNKHTSLLLQNNYDNQNKNLFSVGVRFDFGGVPQIDHTLESQMTSPIIRHIARQSYGDASPTRLTYAASGPTVTQSNVWFFSPTGAQPAGLLTTFNDCTAEHPCSSLDTPTAQTIGNLSPNANLFFASGNYAISTTSPTSGWINLSNGQSISGRNTGWITPATGSNRPVIQGGLLWGNEEAGISANGSINNMLVRNSDTLIPTNYLQYFNYTDVLLLSTTATVLGVGANGALSVNNSDIRAFSTLDNTPAVGIASNAALTVNNTNVNVLNAANATLANSAATAVGIRGAGDVVINNSTLNAQARGKSENESTASALGVDANGNISASRVQVMAFQSNSVDNLGFSKAAAVSSTSNALVVDSTLVATANGSSQGDAQTSAIGVNVKLNAVVDHSTINATQNCSSVDQKLSQAFGVLSYGNIIGDGNLTVRNLSSIKAVSYGLSAQGGETTAFGIIGIGNIVLNDSFVSASQLSTASNSGDARSRALLNYDNESNITISNSQINSTASGLSAGGGDTSAFGMETNGDVVISNTDVSVIQSSQGDNQSNANALGIRVQTDGHVTANGTTIVAKTTGMAASGGSVNATAISSGVLSFVGKQSTITAISQSNTGIAQAIDPIAITNTANAQCSNDGINYQPCQ